MTPDASRRVAPREEAGLTSCGGLGNQQHHDEGEHMEGMDLVAIEVLLVVLYVQ